MKNLFPPFAKLVAVAACALTLGSCSRAEYAMLPKGSSYHGVTRVATPVPAAAPQLAATAPVAATAPETVAAAPEVAPAEVKADAPSVKATAPQPAAAQVAALAASGSARPAAKPNFAQRLLLNKTMKKVDKLMAQAPKLKQHSNTASTSRLDGSLRTALLVLLIGVIIAAFSGVSNIFGIIGGILIIVGLVLLLLYLLDQM
ncbi:hypothetical protein [Hymenobacter terricola]|uniref:hypothetical protein n=1 Tax=Hymenobacter terricola TaxID=2819236 RepID=UPI001B316F98|nr:hypothetical protein [Hymenobacter terricola]